jgi:hypothetical protein
MQIDNTAKTCWHATPPTYCTIVFDCLALNSKTTLWAVIFYVPFCALSSLSSVLQYVVLIRRLFDVPCRLILYLRSRIRVVASRAPVDNNCVLLLVFGDIRGNSNMRQNYVAKVDTT